MLIAALGAALIGVLLAPFAASADTEQPYAGQQQRQIKALDAAVVDGLRRGAGLGYAKPVELNGWPGPLHALELRDELRLSGDQIARLQAVREAMLAAAIPLGLQLIEAERALDQLFASGTATAESVAAASGRAADIGGRLRAAHLQAHIETAPILSRHQRMLYGRARGYGAGAHHHYGVH